MLIVYVIPSLCKFSHILFWSLSHFSLHVFGREPILKCPAKWVESDWQAVVFLAGEIYVTTHTDFVIIKWIFLRIWMKFKILNLFLNKMKLKKYIYFCFFDFLKIQDTLSRRSVVRAPRSAPFISVEEGWDC